MQYMPPPPPYGYPQPGYQTGSPLPPPQQAFPTWHGQQPGYPNQVPPYAYNDNPQPNFPPGAPAMAHQQPPMSAPPPMMITGKAIINLTTNQVIYTISTSSSGTKISLIHTATGLPIGQGERHTFSSNTVTVAGRTSKLKSEEASLSDRWAYVPTWEHGGVKWYFKNRKKLDFRLMDAKSEGRQILAIEKGEIRFERLLNPEQVGELLLALVVLREQIKEDKKVGDEVTSSVLESVLL
ncbi:hypothetical protein Q7P37_004781 [Cladosporium fusiforme]